MTQVRRSRPERAWPWQCAGRSCAALSRSLEKSWLNAVWITASAADAASRKPSRSSSKLSATPAPFAANVAALSLPRLSP